VEQELAHNKVFVQGCDKQGRPICVLLGERHVAEDAQQNYRFIIYTLVRALSGACACCGTCCSLAWRDLVL
jgi:hypothetical protein